MLHQLDLPFPRYRVDILDPVPPRAPVRRLKGKAVRIGMLVYYPDDPDWRPDDPDLIFWRLRKSQDPLDQIIIY